GGVNTKKSKLNLKLVVPIVLLVAALGGFYIFKKSSAAGVTVLQYQTFSPVLTVVSSKSPLFVAGSCSESLIGPFSYSACVWARAPQGKATVTFPYGKASTKSIYIPQSTSFARYCSNSFSVEKNKPSLSTGYLYHRSGGKVEVQRSQVERL